MAKIQIKSEKLTPFGGFFFDYGAIWFSLPWGHHKLLIDKFLTVPQKALFYVRQTVANGWSRNVLHNFIDSSLYERQGKALSNFNRTLPDVGQLGGYVVACNHLLRKEGRDNPTIGILICKEKDRIQAQYALESSYSPAGSRLLCFTQNDHIGHAGFKICPFLKWAHFSCIILVSCADTRVVYRKGVS